MNRGEENSDSLDAAWFADFIALIQQVEELDNE